VKEEAKESGMGEASRSSSGFEDTIIERKSSEEGRHSEKSGQGTESV